MFCSLHREIYLGKHRATALLRLASTTASPTHYEVLGISTSSSPKDIKAAFRKLSKKLHPDMNQHLCEEEQKSTKSRYIRIVHSYEVLSNEGKRRDYDKRIINHSRKQPHAKVYSPGGINVTRGKVHYGASYRASSSPYANIYSNTNDVPHFDYDTHLQGNLWFERRMINKRIHKRSNSTNSRQEEEDRFQERFKAGRNNDTNEILNLHRYGDHQYRDQTSYDIRVGPLMAIAVAMTVLGVGVYMQ